MANDSIKYTRICDKCCRGLRDAGQLLSMSTATPQEPYYGETCESCGEFLVSFEINQATVIL